MVSTSVEDQRPSKIPQILLPAAVQQGDGESVGLGTDAEVFRRHTQLPAEGLDIAGGQPFVTAQTQEQ